MQLLMRGKEETPQGNVFRISLQHYAMFRLLHEKFGPPENELLDRFGLKPLVEPDTWATAGRPTPDGPSLAAKIRYAMETFPKFAKILDRETDENLVIQTKENKKGAIQTLATKKITFLVRESDALTLTLKELSSILSDIENIFQSIVKITGAPPSDLVVAALDSGSEKSLDLVGVATAVDKLTAFLLEAWDRVRFARTSKMRASIKTASEGLAVLNELKAAQEKGAISAEEAEKLKRTVLKSVEDLFSKGVYIPEMEESIPVRPSEIPYQRTKLLTHYSGESSPNDAATDGNIFDDESQPE
jgi:hypothetical protein